MACNFVSSPASYSIRARVLFDGGYSLAHFAYLKGRVPFNGPRRHDMFGLMLLTIMFGPATTPDATITRVMLTNDRVLEVRRQSDWIPGTQTPANVYRFILLDRPNNRERELGFTTTPLNAPLESLRHFRLIGIHQLGDEYVAVAFVRGHECVIRFLPLVEAPRITLPRTNVVVAQLHRPPDAYYLAWRADFEGDLSHDSLTSTWWMEGLRGPEAVGFKFDSVQRLWLRAPLVRSSTRPGKNAKNAMSTMDARQAMPDRHILYRRAISDQQTLLITKSQLFAVEELSPLLPREVGDTIKGGFSLSVLLQAQQRPPLTLSSRVWWLDRDVEFDDLEVLDVLVLPGRLVIVYAEAKRTIRVTQVGLYSFPDGSVSLKPADWSLVAAFNAPPERRLSARVTYDATRQEVEVAITDQVGRSRQHTTFVQEGEDWRFGRVRQWADEPSSAPSRGP